MRRWVLPLAVGGLVGILAGTALNAAAQDPEREPAVCREGEWVQEMTGSVDESPVGTIGELVSQFGQDVRADGALSDQDSAAMSATDREFYAGFMADYLGPTRSFSMDGAVVEQSGERISITKFDETKRTIEAVIYALRGEDGTYTFASAILCESQLAEPGSRAAFQRGLAELRSAAPEGEGD